MKKTFTDQIDDYYLNTMFDELLDYIRDEEIVSKDVQYKLINKVENIQRELSIIKDNAYHMAESLDDIKLSIEGLE